jgi:hypothetical protein
MTKKNLEAATEIDAILGEGATDELKEKARTVFEAAVAAKVAEQMVEVNAKIDEMVEAQLAEKLTEIEENVDRYVSFVAEEWLAENEMAIESALRVERADAIVEGLLTLFAEHNLEVPEGSESVVDALVAKNEELSDKINAVVKENLSLKDAILEGLKSEAVAEASEGLTDVQSAKLKALSEGLKHRDIEDFKSKLSTLKESFFKEVKESKAGKEATKEVLPIADDKKQLTEAEKIVEAAKMFM